MEVDESIIFSCEITRVLQFENYTPGRANAKGGVKNPLVVRAEVLKLLFLIKDLRNVGSPL